MKKNIKAAVLGYYGYDNLGDEAVLGEIIKALSQSLPRKEIAVIARKKGEVNSVRYVSRTSAAGILSTFFHTKLLVVGGGSLLQDATSRRSLAYYSLMVRAAKMCGCKIVMYSNGLGPLNNQLRAARALWKADSISLRDPDSQRLAISLGADPERTSLTADPVFSVKKESAASARGYLSSLGIKEDERFFAVSLRELPRGEKLNETALAAACARIKKSGTHPLFLPMENEKDSKICERVSRLCGGTTARVPSAEMLAGVLAEADFALGMRLHFLLCSALAATAFVALSYDCKIDSAVKYIGSGTLLRADSFTYEALLTSCRMAQSDSAAREYLKSRSVALAAKAEKDSENLARLAGETVSPEKQQQFIVQNA